MSSKGGKGSGGQSDDDAAIFVIPIIIVFMACAMWFMLKEPLYYGAAKMAFYMLMPLDSFESIAQFRQSILQGVRNPPSFGVFFTWANAGFRIPSTIIGLICLFAAYKAWTHPYLMMRGQLSVDALMRFQATVHDPIAPMLHIAKDMHKNLDERFHEAYHPHEAVEKFKLADADGTLNRERAEAYFVKQLGRRVYRPGIDSPNTVFADRLDNYEKAIFAMLAPMAINLKDGLPEYVVLRRALNYSACNATNTPNLALANEMYQKYRAHPLLNNLFQFHHFSATYLFQLYIIAKRAGGFSSADWQGWLRPHANSLYATVNCAGRSVSLAEAGGAFSHWKFEVACRLKDRVPIIPCVTGAVDDLAMQYEAWLKADKGITNESLWGKMANGSAGISPDSDLFRRYVTEILHIKQPPEPPGDESLFDTEQAEARRVAEDAEMVQAMEGMRKSFPASATQSQPS